MYTEQLGQSCFHLDGALVVVMQLNPRFSEYWTSGNHRELSNAIGNEIYQVTAGRRVGRKIEYVDVVRWLRLVLGGRLSHAWVGRTGRLRIGNWKERMETRAWR